MGDLSKNFNRAEFKCKCGSCVQVGPDPRLIAEMQAIRDDLGKSIVVNSGHRCVAYNARVGGAPKSQHILGTACDFTVAGMTPNEVQEFMLARFKGRYGIGRYKTFTHFDVRGYEARWDLR